MRALVHNPLGPWLVLGLYTAIVVAGVACRRGAWAASPPRRRQDLVAAVGVLVAGIVAWALGRGLPVDVFSPVREGFTPSHAAVALGLDHQAGPLWRMSWAHLLAPSPGHLRDVVAANDGFAAASATAVGLWAHRRAGWAGALVGLGVMLSLHARHAALGETSAAMLWPVALATAAFGEGWLGARRPAALVGLVACAGLFVLGRGELAAVPVAFGVAGALRPLVVDWEDRWAAWSGRQGWRWLLAIPVVAAWWALASGPLAAEKVDLRTFGQFTWALVALDPRQIATWGLPVAWAGLVPPGAFVLAMAGLVASLRRPLRSGAVALVLCWLFGTYWIAGHGGLHGQARPVAGWEMYRYLMHLVPWAAVLAVEGLARWPWPRLRAVVVVGALLPALWPASLWPTDHPVAARAGGHWPTYALDTDAAVEVRALAQRLLDEPTCAVVTFGQPWHAPYLPMHSTWVGLVPFRGGHRLVEAPGPADMPWPDVLEALGLSDVPCGVAWRGLDCDADASNGCPTLDDSTRLDGVRRTSVPTIHANHGTAWPAKVVVGWVRIDGVPPRPE